MGIGRKGTHTAKLICLSRIIFAIILSIILTACNTGSNCAAYAYQQCDEFYPDFNCTAQHPPYNFRNSSYSPTVYYYPTTAIHCPSFYPLSVNTREGSSRPPSIDGVRPHPHSTAVKAQVKRQ